MKGAKEVSPIWARIMRKSRGRVCIGPTSKPVIWNRQLQARRSVWNICWQAAAFQGLQRFRGFEGCGLRLPCKANTHAWVKSLLHSNQMGGGAEAMSHCLPNAKGYTRWRSDRKRDRHAADMKLFTFCRSYKPEMVLSIDWESLSFIPPPFSSHCGCSPANWPTLQSPEYCQWHCQLSDL